IVNNCSSNWALSVSRGIGNWFHRTVMKDYSSVDRYLITTDRAENLFTQYGVDRSRFRRILNPIDWAEFGSTPSQQKGDFALYVGSHEPAKGSHRLLDSLQYFPKGTHILVSLGEQTKKMRPKFEKMADRFDLN